MVVVGLRLSFPQSLESGLIKGITKRRRAGTLLSSETFRVESGIRTTSTQRVASWLSGRGHLRWLAFQLNKNLALNLAEELAQIQ